MFEGINLLDILKPELLVLIPVCWGFGMLVKSIKAIPNRYIPFILVTISVLFTTLYILGTGFPGNIYLLIFTILTQGIGYWAVAWAFYEKFIKMGITISIKKSEITADTTSTNNE